MSFDFIKFPRKIFHPVYFILFSIKKSKLIFPRTLVHIVLCVFINRANKKKKKKKSSYLSFRQYFQIPVRLKRTEKRNKQFICPHTYKPPLHNIEYLPRSAHIIHRRFSHCAQRSFKSRSIIRSSHSLLDRRSRKSNNPSLCISWAKAIVRYLSFPLHRAKEASKHRGLIHETVVEVARRREQSTTQRFPLSGVAGAGLKFGLDLAPAGSNSKFRHVTCASGRFEKVSNPSLASRERLKAFALFQRHLGERWKKQTGYRKWSSFATCLFRTRLIRVFELV